MRLALAAALIIGMVVAGCATPPGPGSVVVRETESVPIVGGAMLIDGHLHEPDWADALRWTGDFVIRDHPKLEGTFPFELRVLAQGPYLLVGVEIKNISTPPHNTADGQGTFPDVLNVMLSTATDGLRPPADMIEGGNAGKFGTLWRDYRWTGSGWEQQDGVDEARYRNGTATGGRWVATKETPTNMTWEFIIPRTSRLPDVDGFQLPQPGIFGLRIQLLRQDLNADWDTYSDLFPRSGPPPGDYTKMDDWIWLRFTEPSPPVPDPRQE